MIECGDCRIPKGKLHTYGCDIERCPKCKGQLISCSCEWKDISNTGKILVDIDGKQWQRLIIKTECDM